MQRSAGAFEGVDVGDRRSSDVCQRFGREEALMSRDQHIGESQKTRELVVQDRLFGPVLAIDEPQLSSPSGNLRSDQRLKFGQT